MELTLLEVLNLFHELNGYVVDNGTERTVVSTGILKQKLPLKVRVYLQRVNLVVTGEATAYYESLKEMREKHPSTEEGDRLLNKEIQSVLATTRIVDIASLWNGGLKVDDFQSIETDEHYPVLFKLIDV